MGNIALERGQKIEATYRSARTNFPSKQEMDRELGGVEGFFTMFGIHYCNMFASPRMSVLFDTRHADTYVCALEHGKRVASNLLDSWYGTNYYEKLGRGHSPISMIEKAH